MDFHQQAARALRFKRDGLLRPVAIQMRAVREGVPDGHDPWDAVIVSAIRLFTAMAREDRKEATSFVRITRNTPAYLACEHLAHLCKQNGWLMGEFIQAQFFLKGKYAPHIAHLDKPGALRKFQKYLRMFGGSAVKSVTRDESERIRRAVASSVQNLMVLFMARGMARLDPEDYSFVDRYTLAYLAERGAFMLPKDSTSNAIWDALKPIRADRHTMEGVRMECQAAAQKAVQNLRDIPDPRADAVNKLKREVVKLISSLYL
jgi:hypothetical protein